MDELNNSYADKVMARDNSPIPVNLLAKEHSSQPFAISPARFNFKPNINISTPLPQRQPVTQRPSHAAGSLTDMFGKSPPNPHRISHATGGGRGGLTRTFSQRSSPDDSMHLAQRPKFSLELTEEERANMVKKQMPDYGFLLIETMTNRMEKLEQHISETIDLKCAEKIEHLEERVDNIREGMIDMSVDMDIIREKANKQREELNDLGVRSRENNLLFAGFPENRGESEEDMENLVREQIAKITDPEILKKHPNLKDAVITKIHRNKQFKQDQTRPRDIIVKFLNYKERAAVLKGKRAMDEGIYVNPDYPPSVVFAERTLKPILNIVKGTPYGENKRVKLVAGVLFVDHKRYTLHNLVALPSAIKFYQNSIRSSFEVLAWFGILSIFSNFFWAPMVIDGKEFATAEQFIQYCKALFFGDRYHQRLLLTPLRIRLLLVCPTLSKLLLLFLLFFTLVSSDASILLDSQQEVCFGKASFLDRTESI